MVAPSLVLWNWLLPGHYTGQWLPGGWGWQLGVSPRGWQGRTPPPQPGAGQRGGSGGSPSPGRQAPAWGLPGARPRSGPAGGELGTGRALDANGDDER